MKVMLVEDVRNCNPNPEGFSNEMGISLEEAIAVLKYVANQEIPGDYVVVLDELVLEDGTTIVEKKKKK